MSQHLIISPEEHRLLASAVNLDVFSIPEKCFYIDSVEEIFRDRYSDGNLTMEQFYQLSQMHCYYCGDKNSNQFNKHRHRANDFKRATGPFLFNGLDRTNNSLPHNLENCVAACFWCNYAKCEDQFLQHLAWRSRIITHFPTWQHLSASELVSLARSKIAENNQALYY